jgi:hypothetical protein
MWFDHHSKPDAAVGLDEADLGPDESSSLSKLVSWAGDISDLVWSSNFCSSRTSSRPCSPSSLVARDLDLTSIVLVLVLNWGHTVHSRCALELDRLAVWTRRSGWCWTLLENTLGGAWICVRVHWGRLFAELSQTNWTEGRWRYGCPGHGTRWSQWQSWASRVGRSRNAERQLWLGCACGVHFFRLLEILIEGISI